MYGVRGHAQAERGSVALRAQGDGTHPGREGGGLRQKPAVLQWGAGDFDELHAPVEDSNLVTSGVAQRKGGGVARDMAPEKVHSNAGHSSREAAARESKGLELGGAGTIGEGSNSRMKQMQAVKQRVARLQEEVQELEAAERERVSKGSSRVFGRSWRRRVDPRTRTNTLSQ
jgi:hypothetical protein